MVFVNLCFMTLTFVNLFKEQVKYLIFNVKYLPEAIKTYLISNLPYFFF